MNCFQDMAIVLTLLPYYESVHCVDSKELEYLKNSTIITKNKIELINLIDEIEKNKSKKCTLCNDEFNKICELKKHVIISCFYKELKKRFKNTTKC
jgi:hypothetical protein